MKEIDIIQQCKEGDFSLFENLVQPYMKTALRTSYLMTHDKYLAQDAVQEALIELYKNMKNYDPERASFKTFFMRIVTFRSINLIKKNKKPTLKYDERLDSSPSPLNIVLVREEQKVIQETINKLKPEFRAVIILYYYNDLSISEISKILDKREGTIKSRLFKARQIINKSLGDTLHNKIGDGTNGLFR